MIYCPFKYNDQYIYCDCPYPKTKFDCNDILSLQYTWRNHLVELKDNGDDWENVVLKNRKCKDLDEVHSV